MYTLFDVCTFCFDLECSPDQSKQGGIKGNGAITVERHVHANQALWTTSGESFGHQRGIEQIQYTF